MIPGVILFSFQRIDFCLIIVASFRIVALSESEAQNINRFYNYCFAIDCKLISRLIVFTIQELDCIGALSFFTIQTIWIVLGRCLFMTRRGVLEKSFFWINFIGVIFEAGNKTREKICSDFGAEQKWRAERKESGFCSYRCFWESEELICEKIFSKRAKFFYSRAAF